MLPSSHSHQSFAFCRSPVSLSRSQLEITAMMPDHPVVADRPLVLQAEDPRHHPARGVIHHVHQTAARSSSFQPIMKAAVQLHQLAKIRLSTSVSDNATCASSAGSTDLRLASSAAMSRGLSPAHLLRLNVPPPSAACFSFNAPLATRPITFHALQLATAHRCPLSTSPPGWSPQFKGTFLMSPHWDIIKEFQQQNYRKQRYLKSESNAFSMDTAAQYPCGIGAPMNESHIFSPAIIGQLLLMGRSWPSLLL
jgi:hypothetical protein